MPVYHHRMQTIESSYCAKYGLGLWNDQEQSRLSAENECQEWDYSASAKNH